MIMPLNGSPHAMKKYDYAFLPEDLSVTRVNRQRQGGLGAP
jgi:glyoxylate utilization-related uncharacterized protein